MSHEFNMTMNNQSEVDSSMDIEDDSTSVLNDKIIRIDMEWLKFFEDASEEALIIANNSRISSLDSFYELGHISEEEMNFIVERMMKIYDLGFQFKHFPKEYIVCKLNQRNFDFSIWIPWNLQEQLIFVTPQIHRDEYEIIVERWITEYLISKIPDKTLSKSLYNSHELIPIDIFENENLDHKDLFIGQGGFGKVFKNKIILNKLYRKQGNEQMFMLSNLLQEESKTPNQYIEVVIKLYKKTSSKNDDLAFINEARFLMASNHENVIRYYGIVEYQNMIGLVLEYCSRGSLKTYLKSKKKQMRKRLLFAIDAVCGLAFMHSKGICHLDLKPDNIFVSQNKRCKLGDFGLALGYLETNKKSHGFTINYAAPEILQKEQYSEKSDIWSLGMTLYWLFIRRSPCEFIKAKKVTNKDKFSIGKEEMIYQIVFEGKRPDIDKTFEGKYQELADLMKLCWQLDPNNRPNAYNVLLELQRSLEKLIERKNRKNLIMGVDSLNIQK